jgi:ABC-type uncharacterized transport system involved in gliding motility auxiliary subunit
MSRLERPAAGYVLGLTLHVALVLVVLGEIVFLASRHRVRLDLTAEKLFTLTDSTRRVLDRLEDRLLIEAYFSPDSQLSSTRREMRQTLKGVLDEFVQNSRGRVVVQYLDPQSDNDLREKATRLGITPQTIGDRGEGTLEYKELWQGLRLRYGGDKQKVIPQLPEAQQYPYIYEAILTPVIKALTVKDKPKIGFAAWPSEAPVSYGGPREPGKDFRQIREIDVVKDRYQLVPLTMEQGALVPDDIGTVLLFRPKNLTDRQKYVLDQFVMRGGQLVVFADTDDFSIGQNRDFDRRVLSYDAPGSTLKFQDQLAAYGVEVRSEVLLDAHQEAREPFAVPVMVGGGMMQAMQQLFYPYWFHALPVTWADRAEELAKGADGSVDEALVAQYKAAFQPGVDMELAKNLGNPGMFWPCPVGPAPVMPDGVTTKVLLRTSPRALATEPAQHLNPLGKSRDPRQRGVDYNAFVEGLQTRLRSEPAQQFGLMAVAEGTFRSVFAGKEVPLTPEAERKKKEQEAAVKDPLANDVGDPLKPDEAKPERIGPELEAKPPEPPAPEEPPALTEARAGARVVVIGDSDFVRDDLAVGEYARIGGPISRGGPLFFVNLLDWLAQDQDLFELRNKQAGDRTLRFLSDAESSSTNVRDLEDVVGKRQTVVRTANVVVPPVLLLAFGALVMIRRRGQKREFLARVGE